LARIAVSDRVSRTGLAYSLARLHTGTMDRIHEAFRHQGPLHLMGATLVHVAPGEVDIALPFRPEVAQHHGFFHGGVIATVLDVACGFAALTRMEPEQEVLTAEFKLNFLAPARGESLVARGRVVKHGRLLSVCTGGAFSTSGGQEQPVALMQATMIGVRRRG
jgi:uncharacterized protein (TIGR00369 family)